MNFSIFPFARTGLASVLACTLGLIAASAAAAPTPAYEKILKIDVHSHIFEDVPAIHALFARINVRTINVCVPGGDGHLALMDRVAFELYGKHPQLYPLPRPSISSPATNPPTPPARSPLSTAHLPEVPSP